MTVRHSNPKTVAGPTGAYSLVSIATPASAPAWISGQTGRNPDGSFADSVLDQSRRALANIAALVEALGASPLQILHMRTFLVGRETMPAFIQAREECFRSWYPESPPPASTLAFVEGLADPRALVEVEAVVATAIRNRSIDPVIGG